LPIDGKQFGSDFVALNPNSKIPCMAGSVLITFSNPNVLFVNIVLPLISKDHGSKDADGKPLRIFESASILLYLAEKFDYLLPKDPRLRVECMNWVFWQMASTPYVGGGFGHFYAYAPFKQEYPINRFAMETKRQLDVLDKHLEGKTYMCGDEYTIADIAIWPWYGVITQGKIYDCADFLQVKIYKNVCRWTDTVAKRTAVIRGRCVNRSWGSDNEKLPDRHSRECFKKIGL
jgi:GST-like protein